MEYADVVWGNKTLLLINKLENVQIEAARIVTGGTRLISINGLYKETGWQTLQARREHHKNNIYYFLPSTVRLRNSEPTSIRDSRSPSSLNSYYMYEEIYYYSGTRIGLIYHMRLRTACNSLNHHLFLKNIAD